MNIARYDIILEATSNFGTVKKDASDLASVLNRGQEAIKRNADQQQRLSKAQEQTSRTSSQLRSAFLDKIKTVDLFGVNLGGVITRLSMFRDSASGVVSSIADFERRIVGQNRALSSFSSILRNGAQGLSSFGTGFLNIVRSVPLLNRGLNAVTGGLRLFRAALIGTGIGAIVIAFTSLLALFTRTQRGLNLMERASTAVGTAFAVVTDRLSSFADGLLEIATDENGDFSITAAFKSLGTVIVNNVINRFKSLLIFGRAVSELLDGEFRKAAASAAEAAIQLGTGLDADQQSGIAAGIANTVEEIEREVTAADLLIQRLQALREARLALEVATARSRSEQKELNRLVEDTTATFTERIDAARRVGELESGLLNRRISLQQEEVDIIKAQNALGETTLMDKQRLADAEVKLAGIVTESQERQTTNQNKLNTLIAAQRTAIQRLGEEYANLSIQLDIDTETDPLRRLTLEAARQFQEIERRRSQSLSGLSILGLTPEQEQIEIDRINEIADRSIEALNTTLRTNIQNLNNSIDTILPQQTLIERFISGDDSISIDQIFSEAQFSTLAARARAINEQLNQIGTPGNVGEARLVRNLQQELQEIIELLGDSPEADQIKMLLGSLLQVDTDVQQQSQGGFLQRLLGLDDEGFAVFQEAANKSLEATRDFVNSILEEQQRRLDGEIETQQENVARATELAEQGNSEILRAEQDRLNTLIQEREQAAARQQALAQVEAAANTLIGLTNAIAQPFPVNLAAFPLVLALIGQLSGGLGGIPAFKEGTELVGADPRYKGNKASGGPEGFLGWFNGRERIIPEDINDALKGIPNSMLPQAVAALEILSNRPSISQSKMEVVRASSSTDDKGVKQEVSNLGAKLDRLTDSVENMKMRVSIDAKGFNATQESVKKRNKRRSRSIR